MFATAGGGFDGRITAPARISPPPPFPLVMLLAFELVEHVLIAGCPDPATPAAFTDCKGTDPEDPNGTFVRVTPPPWLRLPFTFPLLHAIELMPLPIVTTVPTELPEPPIVDAAFTLGGTMRASTVCFPA